MKGDIILTVDKLKKDKEDRRQKIYNNIGTLLVIGIIGGSGLLLVKYSDEKKEPIKITEPSVEGQKATGVKGEQTDSGQVRMTKRVNINTANAEELDKLEGIGPATAQKIIDYRDTNGPFQKIEDIMNVSGIGEGKFRNIEGDISL
ncbi:hypothetical protein C4544_06930 [candidate division WS5 bacterium]|uniref:Helix-hairpin-helix DNA-binding motif class 1 domain-containing protein n=1 Tax=candidate division WS5 bacterium TaxID=2093353 RepID=A0A419DAG2_9BACT|nr:MAG: hypothetical protein C4544_06930 [candidate division WS5 bacterium]